MVQKRQKDWLKYKFKQKILHKKKKVMWLVKPVNYWGVAINPLSGNFTKWSNTLKQFVSKLPTNCLSLFDHFEGLVLKACVRYFHQIFIFSPNSSPSKTMKNAFYFIWKALFVLEIFNFLYFCPSFFFYLSAIALEDDRW